MSLDRETAINVVVDHYVAQDADPREQSVKDFLDDLSESHHWDALDNDENIDHVIGDNRDVFARVHGEYCSVKNAADGLQQVDPNLASEYRDAESKAETQLALSGINKNSVKSITYAHNISYVKSDAANASANDARSSADTGSAMQSHDLRLWYERLKQEAPLSDAERTRLSSALDGALNSPRDLSDAQAVTALWARRDGPGQEKHLSSSHLQNIYRVESQPVTPSQEDPRMQSRVVAGKTVYQSGEYDHRGRSNVIEDGQLGRQTTAKRLDIVHAEHGVRDRFAVEEVSVSAHTPYGSGRLSQSKEVARKPAAEPFNTFEKAANFVDQKTGKAPEPAPGASSSTRTTNRPKM